MINEYYQTENLTKDMSFCFNPSCKYIGSKVFSINHLHNQNKDCKPWIASSYQLAKLSSFKDQPFNFQKQLNFKSNPLQTQAYLHYHQNNIIAFMKDYILSLKQQIMKQFELLTESINKTVDKMFKFNGYEEIMELLNEKYISNFVKQFKLKQIIEQDIFKWDDYSLPTIKIGEQIIENIKSIFQKLESICDPSIRAQCKRTEIINLSQFNPNIPFTQPKKYEQSDLKIQIQQNPTIKIEYAQNNAFEKIFAQSQTQIGPRLNRLISHKPIQNHNLNLISLQQFISQTVNLQTILVLIDRSLQKIYTHDKINQSITIQCPYCPSKWTQVHTSQKTRKQKSAVLILNHLYHNHLSIIEVNYNKTPQDKIKRIMSIQKQAKKNQPKYLKKSKSKYFYQKNNSSTKKFVNGEYPKKS